MFRRLGDLYDRLLQKITIFLYYYIPIIAAHLRPFQRSSNIREAYTGSTSFNTGRYAIYILWQPRTIPWYVLNMLKGLRSHHVNTIIVSNHKLTSEQLETLQGLCSQVLVRGNKGLDFGAYKDAILHLVDRENAVERLIMMNDSVYVFNRGLRKLLGELLDDKYQVVSAYENWELHYHFQSFCIGLAGTVLYDPQIKRYWQNYFPISSRRWCIHAGEVKFSQALRKVASSFKIVFDINELLDAVMVNSDLPTLLLHREFVPGSVRGHYPSDDVLSSLKDTDVDKRILTLRRFKETFSNALMSRAQAHTGAFLFAKYLSSPLLKRDIVYRELFTIYEVERMLLELGFTSECQPILDEMRRRGTAAHLKGFAKRRYRLGLL